MSDLFYRAFEEKYRGTRELIKSRLLVYLPFFQPLLKAYPQGQTLDVGCGRGELLELLTDQGFNAKGVDLDDGMLQSCRERGLEVINADAIAYMQALPAGSLCLVTGLHIAEHLPFHALQQLVVESKRVLAPGGLLLLETPNPENISVGTNSFYLDPTHKRPIPSELLSFLPEYYGYQRSKVLLLQESAQLNSEPNLRLMHVLFGVSPDYAVVAQTEGLPFLTEALTPVFEQDYGLTLHTLAERYQQTLEQRLHLIEVKTHQAELCAQKAEFEATEARATAKQFKTASEDAMAQLNAVYSSTSWRMLKPLRTIKTRVVLIVKSILKIAIRSAKSLANKVPAVKSFGIRFLRNHPRLLRLIVNHSETPLSPSKINGELIESFKSLRSVRMIRSVANLDMKDAGESVVILEVERSDK